MDRADPHGRQWPADHRQRLARLRAQAQRAESEIAAVEATVASPEGVVTVTAAPGGVLRRVELSERSGTLPRTRLAELLVETATRAQSAAAARAAEALAPLFGEDSEAVRVLRGQGPTPRGQGPTLRGQGPTPRGQGPAR